MIINYRHLIATLIGSLLVLALSACSAQKGKNHQEAVNAANTRWLSARSQLYLQMANRQFETGDLEQATKSLNEAFSQDPDNPQLYLLAGRIDLERGRLERSVRQFELATKLDPELAEAHYYQGVVLQRWREFGRADAAYTRAYEIEPDNSAYLLAKAEMLVAASRPDEALNLLLSKASYFDQSAAIRSAIAHIYLMRGETAKAIDYLRQASLMRPDDMLLAEELSEALANSGRHGDAIVELERICSDPSYSERIDVMHRLARQYMAAGLTQQAKQVYMQIRRKDSRDAEAWIRLSEIALSEADQSAALAAAMRAMSLSPDRYESYLLAGLVWQNRRNTEQALKLFDRAASLAPGQTEPLIMRGITLQRAGRKDAAAKAYEEALRRQPNDQRAQELLNKLMARAE